ARPTTIAVITSPTGVVWRDIATVLERRWPLTRVVLIACKVQGADAPESIVRAFGRLDRWIAALEADGRPDEAPQLTILARRGASGPRSSGPSRPARRRPGAGRSATRPRGPRRGDRHRTAGSGAPLGVHRAAETGPRAAVIGAVVPCVEQLGAGPSRATGNTG